MRVESGALWWVWGGWRRGGGRGEERAGGREGGGPESEGVEQNKVPAMHLLGQVKSSD